MRSEILSWLVPITNAADLGLGLVSVQQNPGRLFRLRATAGQPPGASGVLNRVPGKVLPPQTTTGLQPTPNTGVLCGGWCQRSGLEKGKLCAFLEFSAGAFVVSSTKWMNSNELDDQ